MGGLCVMGLSYLWFLANWNVRKNSNQTNTIQIGVQLILQTSSPSHSDGYIFHRTKICTNIACHSILSNPSRVGTRWFQMYSCFWFDPLRNVEMFDARSYRWFLIGGSTADWPTNRPLTNCVTLHFHYTPRRIIWELNSFVRVWLIFQISKLKVYVLFWFQIT